jgi:hypothetical protein
MDTFMTLFVAADNVTCVFAALALAEPLAGTGM